MWGIFITILACSLQKKAMDADLAEQLTKEKGSSFDDDQVSNVLSDNRVAMSFTSTAAAPQTRMNTFEISLLFY